MELAGRRRGKRLKEYRWSSFIYYGGRKAPEWLVRERRRKGSVGGAAARAHDEAEAERLLKRGKEELGLPRGKRGLEGRGKWRDEKALLAALVRERTGVKNAWVAERLAMRHEFHVTRAVKRVREEKQLAGLYLELKKKSESWD